MSFSFRSVSYQPLAPIPFVLFVKDGKPVTFRVLHAGYGNPGYLNAIFKARMSTVLDMSAQQANWEADARNFADHIVVGWENVVDDDGKVAEFSRDNAYHFLLALIQPPPDGYPDAFIALRNFVRDADNFRPPAVAADALGKG